MMVGEVPKVLAHVVHRLKCSLVLGADGCIDMARLPKTRGI